MDRSRDRCTIRVSVASDVFSTLVGQPVLATSYALPARPLARLLCWHLLLTTGAHNISVVLDRTEEGEPRHPRNGHFFVCVRARPVQPLVCAGRCGEGRPLHPKRCLQLPLSPRRSSPHPSRRVLRGCIQINFKSHHPQQTICETLRRNQNTAVS